jgi:fatty-acyl-CoA synthase
MVEGSYASGTSTVPLLGMSIGEMLNSIVAKYPDNEAIISVHQNIRWTYREFLERVDQVARALMGRRSVRDCEDRRNNGEHQSCIPHI